MFTSSGAFMVKEQSIAGIYSVCLAIVYNYPMCIQLSCTCRGKEREGEREGERERERERRERGR